MNLELSQQHSVISIAVGDSQSMRAFIDEEGFIWFCLRDVLSAMGTKSQTNNVSRTITDVFGADVLRRHQLDTGFGVKPVTFVHESGVTYLVANGNTPVSKALNIKVHKEIIPTLRKTGRYEEKPLTRDEIFRLAYLENIKVVEEQQVVIEHQNQIIRKTSLASAKQTAKLIEFQPKVEFFDRAAQNTSGSHSLEAASKILGIPHPRKMNIILKTGIAYRKSDHRYKWLKDSSSKIEPITSTLNNGYMEFKLMSIKQADGKMKDVNRPTVTPKGIQRLSELFPLDNLPPEIFEKSHRTKKNP